MQNKTLDNLTGVNGQTISVRGLLSPLDSVVVPICWNFEKQLRSARSVESVGRNSNVASDLPFYACEQHTMREHTDGDVKCLAALSPSLTHRRSRPPSTAILSITAASWSVLRKGERNGYKAEAHHDMQLRVPWPSKMCCYNARMHTLRSRFQPRQNSATCMPSVRVA